MIVIRKSTRSHGLAAVDDVLRRFSHTSAAEDSKTKKVLRSSEKATPKEYPGLYQAIQERKQKNHEISFCWITPRALARGIEGAIIARLLASTPELMLVGARVYRPSNEFVDEYVSAHVTTHKPAPFTPFVDFLNRELRPSVTPPPPPPPSSSSASKKSDTSEESSYSGIIRNDSTVNMFSLASNASFNTASTVVKPGYYSNPKPQPYSNSLLLLVFTGPNARQKIVDVIGSRAHQNHILGLSGEGSGVREGVSKTIRGSFGEVRQVVNKLHGTVTLADFEPALVGAHSDEANRLYLEVFAKYANSDGGTLVRVDQLPENDPTIGMVMIKPDALSRPTALIGHVMDLFSSTGLVLIGASVFSMSYAQAREFYGFLEKIFEKKLLSQVEKILHERLGPESGAFAFTPDKEFFQTAAKLLNKDHAKVEVDKIVEYMSGIPRQSFANMTEEQKQKRGSARCLALLYQGPNAIDTIRTKLGATNPDQAQPGTVRGEFGDDVMRNTAHASDSFASLQRECKILKFGIGGKSSVKKIIDLWYSD